MGDQQKCGFDPVKFWFGWLSTKRVNSNFGECKQQKRQICWAIMTKHEPQENMHSTYEGSTLYIFINVGAETWLHRIWREWQHHQRLKLQPTP